MGDDAARVPEIAAQSSPLRDTSHGGATQPAQDNESQLRGGIKKNALLVLVAGCLWLFARFMQFTKPGQVARDAFLSAIASLALGVLAAIGYWRERRHRGRQVELAPSLWSGALGGLLGGALAGALADIVSVTGSGLIENGTLRRIWVYCSMSGVLMGVLIQLGSWTCWRLRNIMPGNPVLKALAGLNEFSGGAIGGAAGGIACGAAGGLWFGPARDGLPPASPVMVVEAGIIGAIAMTGGALLFDYEGRLRDVFRPWFQSTILVGVLGGIVTFAIRQCALDDHSCRRWASDEITYYIFRTATHPRPEPKDPDGNFVGVELCKAQVRLDFRGPVADHVRGGIFYGLPSGALLGAQVGLSLLLARVRRPSTDVPARPRPRPGY